MRTTGWGCGCWVGRSMFSNEVLAVHLCHNHASVLVGVDAAVEFGLESTWNIENMASALTALMIQGVDDDNADNS